MKILAATGASGGHIFPALSFLESLRETDAQVKALLVLPRNRIIARISSLPFDVAFISIRPISRRVSFGNFLNLLRFIKGTFESVLIIMKFRPDVIIGFGSISCVPVLLWGKLLGKKTLLHEQNVIPGKANRMLIRFVDKACLSFEESTAYLKGYRRKIVLTGNPLRKDFCRVPRQEALDFLGLAQGYVTILVTGGSQASSSVNRIFMQAVSRLGDTRRIQVLHLCGTQDYEFLQEAYRRSGVKGKLCDFLRPMQYAYSACDLVVSRAGATTITELMYFKVPAVLIPYPFAYGHQKENAAVLESTGAAVVINDDPAAAATLEAVLGRLTADERAREEMRRGYEGKETPQAAAALVRQARSLMGIE